MFRRLTAIEIAEGALLADIGIIFGLLAIYMPVGKIFFHVITPIIFTIIVLRRGFYVGFMSMFVSMVIVGLFSGPGRIFYTLLECGAGLFLGLTMKRHMRHIPLILLGVTSGALCFYALLLLTDFLTGIPISDLIDGLHKSYDQLVSLMNVLTNNFGLGTIWHQHLFPVVDALAKFSFTYWWAAFYFLNWIFLLPVVIVIYYMTNLFVRMLGYSVRPFPSGFLENLQYWLLRTFVKLIPKNNKHWLAHALRREVRRIGIARQKSEA
jgi:hypothetical protein